MDTGCKPGARVFQRPGSVLGVDPVLGPGWRVPGTRDRVPVSSLHHSVTPILHPVSCILHLAYPVCGFFEAWDGHSAWCQVPGIGYRLSGTWDPVPDTW